MGNDIHYNLALQKKRWVSYFDLLGVKSLFDPENQFSLITTLAESPAFKNKENYLSVFLSLSTAIEKLKKRVKSYKNIGYVPFSDTLIVYTDDDSGSFCDIDRISRWFVYDLINSGDGIPIRGAMSCAEFYVDRENDLFFGEALTEAYKYGEAQDWIGFLLCPSVEEQLKSLGISDGKTSNYACTYIPFKKGQCTLNKKLPAFVIGKCEANDNSKSIIEKLSQMKNRIADESIQSKYDRTIEFILKNERVLSSEINR